MVTLVILGMVEQRGTWKCRRLHLMMRQVPDQGKRDWLCFEFNPNTNIFYKNPVYEKRSPKAEN